VSPLRIRVGVAFLDRVLETMAQEQLTPATVDLFHRTGVAVVALNRPFVVVLPTSVAPSIFRDKNTRRIGKSQSNREVAGRNGRRTTECKRRVPSWISARDTGAHGMHVRCCVPPIYLCVKLSRRLQWRATAVAGQTLEDTRGNQPAINTFAPRRPGAWTHPLVA
jgi:hypothetical protein